MNRVLFSRELIDWAKQDVYNIFRKKHYVYNIYRFRLSKIYSNLKWRMYIYYHPPCAPNTNHIRSILFVDYHIYYLFIYLFIIIIIIIINCLKARVIMKK